MSMHSVLEARNNLSRLISDCQSGDDVVITKHGRPVVRLVPVGPIDLVATGVALVSYIEKDPLPSRLRRTPEDLDAQIAEERESWE